MTETWGRSDTAGRWFPPRPVWTIAAFVAALLAVVAIQAYQIAFSWTPLQRWYLSAYVRSGVIGGLGVTATGHYRLLQVTDRRGSNRLALDEEVRPATGVAGIRFTLTEPAVRVGDRQLVWQNVSYAPAPLHAFLRQWIYRDQTAWLLGRRAIWGGGVALAVGLLFAIPHDVARAHD